MEEKLDKSSEYQEANELFESLKLSKWKINEGYKKKGGQATVLAVDHENGNRGVFRYLKNQDEISKRRFYHELKILTDSRFKHKNIVNILEYTNSNEHQWYISERGENFNTFWEKQRENFSDAPEQLIVCAIEILKQICEGLKILHENGVVHRDIKPDNIIVLTKESQTYPVLIDFGVSFSDFNEERITKTNEAVGNVRYSPDVMMNKQDEVLPWLDIFQLAQVLIWMVQISPVKKWSRPLDWRWINYDNRLSEKTILSLRAATAQCSEQTISPQNAGELLILIEELFSTANSNEQNTTLINTGSIKSGIAAGKAKQNIKLAEDLKIMEASRTIAMRAYDSILEQLNLYSQQLQQNKISAELIIIQSFEEFYKSVIQNSQPISQPIISLYELRLGDLPVKHFFVQVAGKAYLPSRNSLSEPKLPDTSNIFTLEIHRYSNTNRQIFPFVSYILTFEHNGKISLRDQQMNLIKIINVTEIFGIIRELCEDSIAWEVIQ